MIKAIAIDDQPIATRVIEAFCRDVEFISLEKTFNDPEEGLRYLNKFPVDLLFLDIDMPGLNGLNLAKKLKQSTMVIFTTSHTEYAIEGFNLNAVDYLGKPFTFERFQQAAQKALTLHNRLRKEEEGDAPKYLFLRANYSLVKVPVADILYIEGLDDYLKIHIENQKTLVVRMTVRKILEKLPEGEFVRIHRSFIVPLKRVGHIRAGFVTVAGKELPIGPTFQEELFKKIGK